MDGLLPARRPRPVADVPAVDAVALTKAWLVALLQDAPLSRAADVPVAKLARGGPSLCSALTAALGTDREVERLDALAADAAAMAGATTPAEAAAAVEALRRATWRLLRGALRDTEADMVADLAERLAWLAGRITVRAVGGLDGGQVDQDAPPPGARVVATGREPVVEPHPLDTLADELHVRRAGGDVGAAPRRPRIVRRPEDPGWGGETSMPPWLEAILERLEQRERDGRPFGVLVAEVDDVERLLAAGGAQGALEEAEQALTAALSTTDLVVRERPGRWWITTPDRGPAAVRALAERVAEAVAAGQVGGVPLTASVGVAVCPDDGEDLDTLASRADESMFAARAAGVRVV